MSATPKRDVPDLRAPSTVGTDGDSEWILLGEFTRSIGSGDRITFTVERSRLDPTLHKVSYWEEGCTGPSEVCTFTHPSRGAPHWARAWDGDRLSPGVLTDARIIARAGFC